ncbi:MAG: peroxiredoxin [Pseudomonadota bacterium]
MLEIGQPAPAFELPDADMGMLNSSDILKDSNLVVYFYPKDDTPGCTMEAVDFSDLYSEFEAANTRVVGISRDNCVSHGTFRDKYGLTVRLLADVEGQACEAYGVWREREKNGEKRMGIVRSTFIVDKSGTIRHALYDVKPKGHAAAVLKLVNTM